VAEQEERPVRGLDGQGGVSAVVRGGGGGERGEEHLNPGEKAEGGPTVGGGPGPALLRAVLAAGGLPDALERHLAAENG
jgi:hypothetical protein